MYANEFRQQVQQQSDEALLSECLRADVVPYVFEGMPAAWTEFRSVLEGRLNVKQADVTIIGSGRFGFSLKPGNNLRPFSDSSDIDVVVVNPTL
jgi:hypothetical protein